MNKKDFKGHSYEQIKKYLESLMERMTERFGYHPWMNHIEEIAKREANKTQKQVEQQTTEGDKEMKKEEKEKLAAIKAEAKVKVETMPKPKSNGNGKSGKVESDMVQRLRTLWESGKKGRDVVKENPDIPPKAVNNYFYKFKKEAAKKVETI